MSEQKETTDSEKVQELRKRLSLYKDMEEKILTGEAQSYTIGGRQLSRYGVSLPEIRKTIKDLENAIYAETHGCARWRGNFYAVDD